MNCANITAVRTYAVKPVKMFLKEKMTVKEKCKMTRKEHPKRVKRCAFCNFWFGDANLNFISSSVGFEYDPNAAGKCFKRGSANYKAGSGAGCPYYAPNDTAKRIL